MVYYILINNKKLNYLELEEEVTAEALAEMFKGHDEKIEVYESLCNWGPFGLIYKNF